MSHTPLRVRHATALLAVLCVLGFLRFYRLSDVGILDDDHVTYLTVAHNWIEGNYYIGANKPGFHLLSTLAAKVIGLYDDTILYLNCSMDLMGIGILGFLSLRSGMNVWLVLAAALVYGCLPEIMYENSRGLPHLTSMAFVAAAAGCAYLYQSSVHSIRKHAAAFVCGVSAAFAGMSHPTALAAAPVLMALIAWGGTRAVFSKRIMLGIGVGIGAYALGFAAAVASIVGVLTLKSHDYILSLNDMVRGLVHHHAASTQGVGNNIWSRAVLTAADILPSLLTPVVWFGSIAALLAYLMLRVTGRAKTSESDIRWPLVLWAVAVGHVAVNIVVDKVIQSRLLIPAAPLMIFATYAILDQTGLHRRNRWIAPLIFAVSLALAGSNVAAHPQHVTKPATIFRQMADQLAHRVDQDNRVLLVPSGFNGSYMETLYLPAPWVYRLRDPWKPQLALIKWYRIRYVMIASNLYRGIYNAPSDDEKAKCDLERRLMLNWLSQNGAKLIHRGEELHIYELTYPPVQGDSPLLTPFSYRFFNSLQAPYIGPRFYRLTKTRAMDAPVQGAGAV